MARGSKASLGIVGWGFVAGLMVVYGAAYKASEDVATITVVDKERIVTGSGETTSSKFLVFAEGEVFENSDSLLFMKWNSSDVQGALREGSTYTVRVAGWRVRFLSMYRNIVEIVEQA